MKYIYETIFEFIVAIIASFVIVNLILGLVVIMVVPLSKYSCKQTGIEMELEYKWNFWAGCFVKNSNGQWIDIENYQSVNLE